MHNYDEQFPINTRERALRFDAAPLDLRRAVRDQLAGVYHRSRDTEDGLLAHFAQTKFQIQRLLEEVRRDGNPLPSVVDALEILAANLDDELERFGVRVTDLTGQTWDVGMREQAELRGQSRREDLLEPRVSYVERPVVWRADRIIAKGAVLVETPPRD